MGEGKLLCGQLAAEILAFSLPYQVMKYILN